MASRLAYGMAEERLRSRWLAVVHPGRRTPLRAIGVIFLIAAALTLSGTLERLAGTTSLLILAVFFVVNGALVWIRSGRGHKAADEGEGTIFRVPLAVPILGMILIAGMISFGPLGSALTAAGIVAAGALLLPFRKWGG